ncbi:MAG: hypothetical protein Q4G14_01050 [Paracoccus sp. (in: a-proteobacteria)]|uniref:hypothetical protein n=1 Tax=Paracoccus sp. TaxID=267 RepID=UPI0026E00647|nr:hypothetical protein [Paracoccus sp. (in: a-proteobacteria)]MDO5611815.1 hypothetical protein [Paracoccus sp. (in: a-proteobacteria)]
MRAMQFGLFAKYSVAKHSDVLFACREPANIYKKSRLDSSAIFCIKEVIYGAGCMGWAGATAHAGICFAVTGC